MSLEHGCETKAIVKGGKVCEAVFSTESCYSPCSSLVKEAIFGKALLEGNRGPIIRGHINGAAQNTLQAIGACESPAVARTSVKETLTLWSCQGQEEAYRS